jgi:biopolymer transport protein TolR
MAGSTEHRSQGALRAQINVTPLVDVVLVLLIIFMVVTPLLTRGKDVQLPAAKTAEPKSAAAEVVVLTVTPDRQLWLETRAIRETDLDAELAARAGRGRELLLKADAQLSMRELRPLLRRLRAAGFDQVSLGVIEPPAPEAAR